MMSLNKMWIWGTVTAMSIMPRAVLAQAEVAQEATAEETEPLIEANGVEIIESLVQGRDEVVEKVMGMSAQEIAWAAGITLALLIAMPFVHMIIRAMISTVVRPALKLIGGTNLADRMVRYRGLIKQFLWALLIIAFVMALPMIWGINLADSRLGILGALLMRKVMTIALIVGIAVVAWEGVKMGLSSFVHKKDQDEGEISPYSVRKRLLLPLVTRIAQSAIIVVAAITILSEIGVDIAPLLASAGVLGLAIGFGAQALVQDIITGAFILWEETMDVGDVVNVGNGHGGLVEEIGVRTVRLRDLSGSVHTIPYSSVTSVINMTKDFSYALMDIGVAYKENVDHVVEVIKDVAKIQREDPEFASLIMDEIEVLGLDSFGDSAVVIKVRIKTFPIKQWSVARDYRKRLKARFDEVGIEIPYPHRTLFLSPSAEEAIAGRREELLKMPETGEVQV